MHYSESDLQNRSHFNKSVDLGSQPLLPVIKHFDKQICSGLNTYHVDHSHIDFRGLIFKRKLDALETKTNKHDEISTVFDSFELNNLMSKLCHVPDENIPELPLIQKIVDYQFFENTYNFFWWQTIIYWFFYIIPMILVVTETLSDYPGWNILMIFVCMLLQTAFFGFEIIQIIHNGPSRYYADPWNLIDVSMFFINSVYFILRICHLGESFLPKEYMGVDDHDFSIFSIGMIFIAIAMIISSGMKGMSLVRHNENFG